MFCLFFLVDPAQKVLNPFNIIVKQFAIYSVIADMAGWIPVVVTWHHVTFRPCPSALRSACEPPTSPRAPGRPFIMSYLLNQSYSGNDVFSAAIRVIVCISS